MRRPRDLRSFLNLLTQGLSGAKGTKSWLRQTQSETAQNQPNIRNDRPPSY